MSTTNNQHRGDAEHFSGLQHFDYSSQAPEVVPQSTLPEAVPAPRYDHQQYNQQAWPKEYTEVPQSAYPDSTYHGSQAGWTSVSQRGPAPIAEEQQQPEAPPPKTILGIRRRKFWLIIGPLLLVLAIGLGVGLGVGLSGSHSGGGGGPQSTLPAAPTPLTCPAGNGTLAVEAGVGFLVVCDVDYNGNDPSSGTEDLTSINATSVEQCMDACATNNQCAGAWFGNYYGEKCFMKSKLGTQGSSDSSIFVIKQT